MLFQNLFKPKWQHSDPRVRTHALQLLDVQKPEDRQTLAEIARRDAVALVRRAAIKRIVDWDVLWECAHQESDAEVRAVALQRFIDLLSGRDTHSPSIDLRRQRLLELADVRVVETIARSGVEAPLRLAALQRTDRESLLGDAVCDDPDAEVRFAAVQRITQKSTLERVAKHARGKDKRVGAWVKTRLAEMAAEAERPELLRQRAKQICAALDALTKAATDADTTARAAALNRDWTETLAQWNAPRDGEFDIDLSQRYTQARAALDAKIAAYQSAQHERAAQEARVAPVREQKRAVLTALEQVRESLQHVAAPGVEDETRASAALAEAHTNWVALGTLPSDEERALQQHYTALVQQLQADISDCQQYRQWLSTTQELSARIADAMQHAQPVAPRDIEQISDALGTLPRESRFSNLVAAIDAARSAFATLCERREEQARQIKVRVEQVKGALRELEAALESGQSRSAMDLQHQIQDLLKNIPEREAATLRKQGFLTRLNQATKQVRELGEWKRWAGAPVKEKLVEEIEALAQELEQARASAHDYHAAARRILAAHQEWKKLGATQRESARELWERFRVACRRAYAPCKAFFVEERRVRAAHRAQKEEICTRLEHYLAQIQPEQFDAKHVERLLRDARTQWERIGPVERARQAALQKRFRAVLDALNAPLRAEGQRNKAKKEALIRRMQSLLDASPTLTGGALASAIEQAKQIQQQWKTIGHSPESQALWNQLRAASDALFALRATEFAAADQQRAANLQRKQDLCAAIEGWAQLRGDALKQARAQFAQAQAEWAQVGTVPRDAARDIERRYADACRRFDGAERDQKREAQAAQWARLTQKAQWCADLEYLADSIASDATAAESVLAKIAEVQTSWRNETALPDALEKRIAQRLQRAVDAVQKLAAGGNASEWQRARSEHQRAREELCVRLEILSGAETPPQARAARMEFQVAMLARTLRHEAVPDSIDDLRREWYCAPSAPRACAAELEQRFQAALPGMKQ